MRMAAVWTSSPFGEIVMLTGAHPESSQAHARAAMLDELQYCCERVLVGDPAAETAKKGAKVIGTRWVNHNKEDRLNPKGRGRLVAQEVNHGAGSDDFYAAAPPLEAKRVLASRWAKERTQGGQPLKNMFWMCGNVFERSAQA